MGMRELAIIGCGKMGAAILEGAVEKAVLHLWDVALFDPHAPSLEKWTDREQGAVAHESAAAAVRDARRVLLAVKPTMVEPVLRSIPPADLGDKLVVSVAAGVSLAALAGAVPGGTRVARVMPNTPALVGCGASAWSAGEDFPAVDAEWIESCFSAIGLCRRVPEMLLDGVTGLSGSGPAYVFTLIEALADGAVREGLPRPLALEFAAQTVRGAATMVMETGRHPAVLREEVASPGGTTIAALAALEKEGFRHAAISAVAAAAERSRELGRG